MKFEHRKGDYELPPIGLLELVAIDERRWSPDGAYVLLTAIAPVDLYRARERSQDAPVLGMPTFYSRIGPSTIGVFPAPDRDYDGLVRFYPPMVSI